MTQPPPPAAPAPTTPPKDSLPYQAAKAALWAPIIALCLGCCTQTITKSSSSVALVIGGANFLLILTGIVCSLIAIFASFKLGPKRLLIRGIIGFILSSVLLVLYIFLVVLVYYVSTLNAKLETSLAGHWQSRDIPFIFRDLTLQPDKHFTIHDIGPSIDSTIDGTWQVTNTAGVPYLLFHADTATDIHASVAHTDFAMKIQSPTADQMTLINNGEDKPETYKRIP